MFAVEVPDLLLLAGESAGAGDQSLGHFLVADRNADLAADLGQQQAEADAPLGDRAIFGARSLLGGVLVGEAAAGSLLLALDLRPDRGELLLDQPFRHFERVARRERVEQLALDLFARGARVFGGDALANARL